MSPKNKSSIRWIDLSEEEKKQVVRLRNAESARKSRQKKKEDHAALEKVCKENEKRINDLEKVVSQLSTEIREKPSSSSASSKAKPSSNKKSISSASKSTHADSSKPSWFGEPF